MTRCSGRAVLRRQGNIVSVVGERQALDDLANVERMHDTRSLSLEVDHIDGVDVACIAALVTDDGDIAFWADLNGVGPEAAGYCLLGVFDLVSDDGQARNFVVTVARIQRHLAVGRERGAAWTRRRIAEVDLPGRSYRLARDGEYRDCSLVAIGDQGQRAGTIDGNAGGSETTLQGRNYHRPACRV